MLRTEHGSPCYSISRRIWQSSRTLNVQPIPFVNLLTRVDDTREFDAILLELWAADMPSESDVFKNVLYGKLLGKTIYGTLLNNPFEHLGGKN